MCRRYWSFARPDAISKPEFHSPELAAKTGALAARFIAENEAKASVEHEHHWGRAGGNDGCLTTFDEIGNLHETCRFPPPLLDVLLNP